MPKKEKQVNIRLSEEQHTQIEEKAKKANFTTTSEYMRYAATNCWPELCKSFLFSIEADGPGDNHDLNMDLTILLKDVRIEEDKVSLTFMLDEKNKWKNFLDYGRSFTIWWLSRKGDRIDCFRVDRANVFRTTKIFPLHLGHDVVELALGMAILKP